MTLGNFVMNGPFQGMSVACILGTSCVVEPTGVGLNDTNQLQVVAGSELCGSASIEAATIQGLTSPILGSRWQVHPGCCCGGWQLCRMSGPKPCSQLHRDALSLVLVSWHPRWRSQLCRGAGDFQHEWAPLAHIVWDCTMGSICSFTLYGSNLALTNRVMVLEETSTCGDAAPVKASFAGLLNPGLFSQIAGRWFFCDCEAW